MRLKFILYPALSLLARLRLPRIAARVLALSVRPFPEHLPSRRGEPASYRVLVLNLNKPGFPGDIEESLLADSAFEVVSWPNYALKAMASAILAPQLSNRRYASDDPAVEASKLQFREFLLALWQRFRELRPIDAVVTANFGYFAQREFGAALKQAGTPLVVLHKENVKSPERVEYWRAIYRTRGAFEGSKILVYSDTEKELQAETGVAAREQIAVTGMPRMDRIHRWRKNHAADQSGNAPQVLFFSFWRKEKLTDMERVTDARVRIDVTDGEWANLSWTELCEGTHKAIIELARRNPQARVVVKTKAQSRRVDDSLNLLRQFAGELPPNLSVVSGGDPFPLIVASSVVIGFNTTALLEALAAGKPVIVPQFGEADDPRMRPLVIDVGDAVERARSPDEIVERASAHLNAPSPRASDLRPAAAEALTFWVGNDDGMAGQRVREAVRDEILRTRHGKAATTGIAA
ncbi:MAG: hypothetical protein HXY30_06605 [Pseudorhodoplanes sp.]|nr:hypothetical protein [Pseudorhodoplanes sp.]